MRSADLTQPPPPISPLGKGGLRGVKGRSGGVGMWNEAKAAKKFTAFPAYS